MMEFHPFAMRFPLLDGEEWESFKASIRRTRGNKVPVIFRMVDGQRQGIDGRNRFRACEELGLKCRMEEEVIDDAEVKEFIIAHNVTRRHMTKEVRQAIVTELREDGKSVRDIAATVGVSHMTIARDLEDAPVVTNVTPETEPEAQKKVRGRDGKSYRAKKAKAAILCQHCQHRKKYGRPLIQDCEDCKKAVAEDRAAKERILCERCKEVGYQEGCEACRLLREKPVEQADDKLLDDAGNVVPIRLVPVFAVAADYDLAARQLAELAQTFKRIEASPAKEAKPLDTEAHFQKFYVVFKTSRMRTKSMRPAIVCQVCLGDGGCDKCPQPGWFTAEQWEARK